MNIREGSLLGEGLSILVTGGTGSFGRKIVGKLLDNIEGGRLPPTSRLIVYSRDELKQHEMRLSLGDKHPGLRFFIGDIRDQSRLRRALEGVGVVIHAAALKQVTACEYNPFEAIKTNVLGAQNLIEAAIDAGVRCVLALSTDKAVNPVNLYGATKLCAEKLFIQGNAYASGPEPRTLFSVVRYGNVAGSRGSVIPLFREQAKTGALTITDPRMTRFWITLDQAVAFVLRCLEDMRGGEIFVPKLPSFRVTDLAMAIAPECKLQYTGIRAGEKLHETLVSTEESRHALERQDSFVVLPVSPWWERGKVEGDKAEEEAYDSDSNGEWLDEQQLRELCQGVPV